MQKDEAETKQKRDMGFEERLGNIIEGGNASLILTIKKEFIQRCQLFQRNNQQQCKATRQTQFSKLFGDLEQDIVNCQRRLYEQYYIYNKYNPLYYIYRSSCKNMHANEFYNRNQEHDLLKPSGEEMLLMRMQNQRL